MIALRRSCAAVLAVVLVAAPAAPVNGQNSELPLQKGQVRQQEVQKLIALLQSDAPLHDKAVACKRLAVMGTQQAVPVLASLLDDPQLAHYARYGLEPIPDPSVDEALRDAMGRLHGRLLVGVINSIGNRRDVGAVAGLSRLLSDSDAEVAAAAAAALGRIGTTTAAKMLEQAVAETPAAGRAAVADACLACADQLRAQHKRDEALALYDALRKADLPKHVHLAATYQAILVRKYDGIPLLVEQLRANDDDLFGLALHAARALGGADVAQALLVQLDRMPAKRQAMVIGALGDLGEPAALPAVRRAARQGPSELRAAALRSLGQLGDASDAPLLLDAAVEADSQVAQAAQSALVGLQGAQVDAAIVARLSGGSAASRSAMIDLVARRRIPSAGAALWKAADDPDPQVRRAALQALGETIPLEGLTRLADRVISPKRPEETEAAKQALKAACVRMSDRDAVAEQLIRGFSGATTQGKSFLLELLSSVGGETALRAVVEAAKSSDDAMQDAATRVLGGWMSVDAAPQLLELAKTLTNTRFRIRTLRGYIRIARQLNLSPAQRLAMCRNAMEVAGRNDEKRLVLDVLRRNPSPESLSLAVTYLGQRGLRGPAAATALAIGQKLVPTHPAQVADAMRQVLRVAKGPQAARAQALLDRANQ